MNVTLKVWRQKGPKAPGHFEAYTIEANPEMSFLEALDVINEGLVEKGEEPIAFEHDCREGICGSCGAVVDGRAQGPTERTALCQVHLRTFHEGQKITVEPFRAAAFPIIKDLVVDRSSLDRIIESGGYISVRAGSAPDANNLPIGKAEADYAFDVAACIGCGACVAACPNASAMLFTAAKVTHLGLVPQGQPERDHRVLQMVNTMDDQGFGYCTNHGECSAVCPKGIPQSAIAWLNRDYRRAALRGDDS